MAVTTTLTNLPTPPQSTDPANFSTRADAFVTALDNFQVEMNDVIDEVNNTETNINAKEASAVSASSVSLASANFKGTWLVGNAYSIPSSVLYNGIYYMAIAPSTGQTPPNATYWEPINVASNISFTPYGNLSSTDVQSALNELDSEKAPKANPVITGSLTLDTSATLIFEGSSEDDYETTLTIVNPTADRTITFPNASGTLVLTTDLKELGVGQAYTTFAIPSERTEDVTYTNSTGKPIFVFITGALSGVNQIFVNGVSLGDSYVGSGRLVSTIVVPNGSTYKYSNTNGGAPSYWAELR
jgi:hypothetical protein